MARKPRTEPTFDSVRRVCLPASVGTMAAGELGIAGVVALLVVTVVAAMVLRGSRTQRDEGAAQSSGAALPPAQGGPLSVASANSRTARHPVATLVMKTSGLLALLPAAWWVVLGTRWGDATCVDDPDACAEATGTRQCSIWLAAVVWQP